MGKSGSHTRHCAFHVVADILTAGMDTICLRAAGLSLMLTVLGCDFPRPPHAISISNPPAIKPSKPSDVQSPEEAMAAVMTVCKEDLHLPVVDPIQMLLYKNTASFASYGEGWRTLPINVDDITAFTRGNEIHVNLEKRGGKKWGASVGLLAHEYGHTIEATVRKGYTTSWFGEGFAAWVSARTLDALGWQDYSVTLERAKFELINSQPLVSFGQLAWDWRALRQTSKGYIKTYGAAFVAVDRLASKGGLPAIMQYFESGEFSKSFHFSEQDLQADFETYLSGSTAKTDGTVIKRPDWNAGDQWTYETKRPRDEPMSTQRVVREERFEGVAAYVIRVKDREVFYSKGTLERLAAAKDGKIITERFAPSQDFSWPLMLGKRWTKVFVWKDRETQEQRKRDHLMIVAEISNVTVVAGTFLTARIQTYDLKSGHLMREYWYSPTTKWIVKFRDYSVFPFEEEELANFKLN